MNRRARLIGFCVLCAAALGLGLGIAHIRAHHRVQADASRLSDGDLLFLEALRRGYLMDDAVVRRQLELRMRETLLREHPEAEPDDAALAAFLAAHADGYQAAARYSFDQVYLSRGAHGAGLTSAANAIAAQLRAHPESYAALGDPFPRGKQLQSLTAVQIEADFGHTLAQDISTQPQGAWQGPLESPLGLHFVRVIAITPARTLTLAEARARLRVDYLEDRKRGVLRAALVQLRQEFSGTAPPPRPARTDEDIP